MAPYGATYGALEGYMDASTLESTVSVGIQYMFFFDASMSVVGVVMPPTGDLVEGGVPGWQSFRWEFPVPPTATSVFFVIRLYGAEAGSAGALYIDDLSLSYNSETPVPVAGLVGLGMLGLVSAVGGIAVIRRKK